MEKTIRVAAGNLEGLIRVMKMLPQGNRLPSDVHLAINLTKRRMAETWAPYGETKTSLWLESGLDPNRSLQPGDESDPKVRDFLSEWGPRANERVEVIVDVIPWERLHAKYDTDAGESPDLPAGFQDLLDLGIVLHPGEDPMMVRDLRSDFPAREILTNGAGMQTYQDVADYVDAGRDLTEIDGIGEATEQKIVGALQDVRGDDGED